LVLAVLQDKRLVFVTNNSTKSGKQYGKKFERLGLSVDKVGFFSDPP
jgi:phosphoglycolate phosphatase